jgi:hypothetical protein
LAVYIVFGVLLFSTLQRRGDGWPAIVIAVALSLVISPVPVLLALHLWDRFGRRGET